MFLRFTYLYFAEDKIAEAKAVYITEIAPVIRQQKGNKQVLLLAPADDSNAFISYSAWEEESDVKAFEASDAYLPVITKVKEIVSKPPLQKYYYVEG